MSIAKTCSISKKLWVKVKSVHKDATLLKSGGILSNIAVFDLSIRASLKLRTTVSFATCAQQQYFIRKISRGHTSQSSRTLAVIFAQNQECIVF